MVFKRKDLLYQNNLLTQKAIRYATLEPVTIEFIDKIGNTCLLKAEKGKLNSVGKLVLLGNATIEYLETKKLFRNMKTFAIAALAAIASATEAEWGNWGSWGGHSHHGYGNHGHGHHGHGHHGHVHHHVHVCHHHCHNGHHCNIIHGH